MIDELYEAKPTPEMLAEEIRKRDLQHVGRMITGICDTSAFANVGLGQSRPAVMNKLGCGWRPATKGPGSRICWKSRKTYDETLYLHSIENQYSKPLRRSVAPTAR